MTRIFISTHTNLKKSILDLCIHIFKKYKFNPKLRIVFTNNTIHHIEIIHPFTMTPIFTFYLLSSVCTFKKFYFFGPISQKPCIVFISAASTHPKPS
jgi:hypothetical protein